MLNNKLLRNNIDLVAKKLSARGFELNIEKFHQLENKRKFLQTKTEELQALRNNKSKEIGLAKSKGADITTLLQEVEINAQELKACETEFKELSEQINNFLWVIPNIPHESVPIGASEKDNVVVRQYGEPKKFDFPILDHVALGEKHGWIDFANASKISGSRFVVLYGKLVKLHRALINFMLDLHINEHGYKEVYVPYIVNKTTLFGTGQLPKFSDDLFHIPAPYDYYLIPTAEVPVTNLVRDEIINIDDLPLKFVCHTPCFRSEAGSYGKDTRGMIRNHQFEKVELVHIVKPENSYAALEELTRDAEKVLQKLELPYQVIALCTKDIGFSAAKTYDLEVWLPSENKYREISSCSNCEDFQARRMQARMRTQNNTTEYLHTLNGSGLAVGRTLIAVIENNQDENGNIHIPKVLQPYFNNQAIL